MKVALVVFFIVLGLAWARGVELTTENYDHFVEDNPTSIIKFYAPWCGHCKKMAPEWEKLESEQHFFGVGEVDCTKSAELCQREGVRGYPTVKLVTPFGNEVYKGLRTAEAFASFVKAHATE